MSNMSHSNNTSSLTSIASVMIGTRKLLTYLPCAVTLVTATMILSIHFNWFRRLGNVFGKMSILGMLVFGTMTSFCAEMVLGENPDTNYAVYSILRNTLSTLIQLISFLLFVKTNGKKDRIGNDNEGIEYFTSFLTICIIAFEIIGFAFRLREDMYKLYIAVAIFGMIQKASQAIVYQFVVLKRKLSYNEHSRKATVLWCYMLSLYNFSMWVQSIVEEVNDHDEVDDQKYDWDIYDQLKETYYALIIDYRLLFALLFLEHGYDFHCKTKKSDELVSSSLTEETSSKKVGKLKRCRTALLVIPGLFILAIQFVQIPSIVAKYGAVVNIVGILTELLVIIFCVGALCYIVRVFCFLCVV